MGLAKFILAPYFKLAMRVLTWALWIITILSAFGGLIPPKIWGFPSVLTLLLPYLAICVAVVSLCWLLARRIVMGLLGIGVLILCADPILTVIPMGHPSERTLGTKTFSVLTYNILHGNDQYGQDTERSAAFDYVIQSDADIVVLQELIWLDNRDIEHFPQSQRDSLFALYPFRNLSPNDGLAVLSKYPVKRLEVYRPTSSESGRFALYSFDIEGKRLDLVNCHLASYLLSEKERTVVTGMRNLEDARNSVDEFKGSILSKLKESFKERGQDVSALREMIAARQIVGPLIVCGDFNDVPASWAYRQLSDIGLKDAWCETHFGPSLTYNRHLFLFHIDQMLYRGPIKALSTSKGTLKASDHYPIEATFEFTGNH